MSAPSALNGGGIRRDRGKVKQRNGQAKSLTLGMSTLAQKKVNIFNYGRVILYLNPERLKLKVTYSATKSLMLTAPPILPSWPEIPGPPEPPPAKLNPDEILGFRGLGLMGVEAAGVKPTCKFRL